MKGLMLVVIRAALVGALAFTIDIWLKYFCCFECVKGLTLAVIMSALTTSLTSLCLQLYKCVFLLF